MKFIIDFTMKYVVHYLSLLKTAQLFEISDRAFISYKKR